MDLGTKLRLIRKLNNLSQEQMADILFTTQGNYSQYENNNRIPSLDLLNRLIERFNLDANWLFSPTENSLIEYAVRNSTANSEVGNQAQLQISILEKKIDCILAFLNIKGS